MGFRLARAILFCGAVLLTACHEDEPTPAASARAEATTEVASARREPETLSLLDLLDTCDVSHRGLSIDLGSVAAETQRSFAQAFYKDVTPVRLGGGSFAELSERAVDYQLIQGSDFGWITGNAVEAVRGSFTHESKLHLWQRSIDDIHHSDLFKRERPLFPKIVGQRVGFHGSQRGMPL